MSAAAFTLAACGAKTDGGGVSEAPASAAETVSVSVQADEIQLTEEMQYGNTSGNISNDAFAAQDGDYIYYVLPAHSGNDAPSGDLTKTNTDGSVNTVLFSGGRPLCLNVAGGWIYYIGSPDGLIYKMRGDGTENTPITSADTQSGFMQGYPGTAEKMAVVDEYIYCRVKNNDRTKGIYKINVNSGEAEQLHQLGALTSAFAVYDGWIYYSVSDDGGTWETHRMRTDGTENTKIADFQISSVNIVNDKIYYIYGDEAQIYSMDLDGANIKRIADGITAVKINVAGDWIYFTDTSAIYKIKTDETGKIKLCDFPSSNFININVLKDWIFLTGNGFNMHKVKTDGSELQEVMPVLN